MGKFTLYAYSVYCSHPQVLVVMYHCVDLLSRPKYGFLQLFAYVSKAQNKYPAEHSAISMINNFLTDRVHFNFNFNFSSDKSYVALTSSSYLLLHFYSRRSNSQGFVIQGINHTAQIFLTQPSVLSCVRHGCNPLEKFTAENDAG